MSRGRMRLIRVSLIYFALVFVAGFVLGTIRVLWLVPRIGVRAAELIEMPVMVLASALAARWISGRYLRGESGAARLSTGFAALAFLFSAELLFGALQGRTVLDVIVNRDPVSGAAYYASLLLFALLPWLIKREAESST